MMRVHGHPLRRVHIYRVEGAGGDWMGECFADGLREKTQPEYQVTAAGPLAEIAYLAASHLGAFHEPPQFPADFVQRLEQLVDSESKQRAASRERQLQGLEIELLIGGGPLRIPLENRLDELPAGLGMFDETLKAICSKENWTCLCKLGDALVASLETTTLAKAKEKVPPLGDPGKCRPFGAFQTANHDHRNVQLGVLDECDLRDLFAGTPLAYGTAGAGPAQAPFVARRTSLPLRGPLE